MHHLLFKEELLENEALLKESFSQAKAYVVTFNSFNHDEEDISNFFYITPDTLNKRFDRAIVVFEHQPSLFDAIESIDESFMPIRGQEKTKANICIKELQWGWQF